MSVSLLGWLFALGVAVHNAEEAWLLPTWSRRPRRWLAGASPRSFRFAALMLSVAVLAAAWMACAGGPRSVGAYLIAGCALAMVLNVVIPHAAASLMLRTYAPGTATAVLLNLPLGSWLIYRSLTEGYVAPFVFVLSGPATVLAIMASIPLLLAAGNKLGALMPAR